MYQPGKILIRGLLLLAVLHVANSSAMGAYGMGFGLRLVQALVHIPNFPPLAKQTPAIIKKLEKPSEIPPEVQSVLQSPIADAGINQRFHEGVVRALGRAGLDESKFKNIRFLVTPLPETQEISQDGVRYIGLSQAGVLAAKNTVDVYELVAQSFPLLAAKERNLTRNFREMQYVLGGLDFPIPALVRPTPPAAPGNLAELNNAFRNGLIPDFSDRSQIAAFAFYRASGFGDATTEIPQVLPSLIAKVQAKWPHLENEKGIFPSVSYQTQVNESPADPELAQLLKEGAKTAQAFRTLLTKPQAAVGEYRKLFGDDGPNVAAELAHSPDDLMSRASLLYRAMDRYRLIATTEQSQKDTLTKKMLSLVHHIGFLSAERMGRMESPTLREQLGAFHDALSERNEFLRLQTVEEDFPVFRQRVAGALPIPIPSEERLGKLSRRLATAKAPTPSSVPQNLATVRELSFGEAPFQSCLGGTDCFSRTYPELALHPDHHAFTLNVDGVEDGKISVFLGTLAGGMRVAFVDKVQNIPDEEIPHRLEAIRQSVWTRGYQLALPEKVGNSSGVSNYDNTRRFLDEPIAAFFPIKTSSSAFRPHRGKLGFPEGTSRAFTEPKVRILGPLIDTEKVKFELGSVPAAYRAPELNFADLNQKSFQLRKGSDDDKIAYMKIHEVLRHLKLATDFGFNQTAIRWLSDPKSSPRLRYQAAYALFGKSAGLGFRGLKTLKSEPSVLASVFNSLWQKPKIRAEMLSDPFTALTLVQNRNQLQEVLQHLAFFGKDEEKIVKLLQNKQERTRLFGLLALPKDLNTLEQIRLIVAERITDVANSLKWIKLIPTPVLNSWLQEKRADHPKIIPTQDRESYWLALADQGVDHNLLRDLLAKFEIQEAAHDSPSLLARAIKSGMGSRATEAVVALLPNFDVPTDAFSSPGTRTTLSHLLYAQTHYYTARALIEVGAKVPPRTDPVWEKIKKGSLFYEFHPDYIAPKPKSAPPPPVAPEKKPSKKRTERLEVSLPTKTFAETAAKTLNDLAQQKFGDLFLNPAVLQRHIKDAAPKGVTVPRHLELILSDAEVQKLLNPATQKMLTLRQEIFDELIRERTPEQILVALGLAEHGVTLPTLKDLSQEFITERRILIEPQDPTSQRLTQLAADPKNWEDFVADDKLSSAMGIRYGELTQYRKLQTSHSLSEAAWGLFHSTSVAPIRLAKWINQRVQQGHPLGAFAQWIRQSPITMGSAKRIITLPTFYALLTPEARQQVYGAEANAEASSRLRDLALRAKYSSQSPTRKDGCREGLSALAPR